MAEGLVRQNVAVYRPEHGPRYRPPAGLQRNDQAVYDHEQIANVLTPTFTRAAGRRTANVATLTGGPEPPDLAHPAEARAGRAGGGATNVDMGIHRLFASVRRTARNGTRIPGKREPFRIVAERRNGLGKTDGRSCWPPMLQLDRYVRLRLAPPPTSWNTSAMPQKTRAHGGQHLQPQQES